MSDRDYESTALAEHECAQLLWYHFRAVRKTWRPGDLPHFPHHVLNYWIDTVAESGQIIREFAHRFPDRTQPAERVAYDCFGNFGLAHTISQSLIEEHRLLKLQKVCKEYVLASISDTWKMFCQLEINPELDSATQASDAKSESEKFSQGANRMLRESEFLDELGFVDKKRRQKRSEWTAFNLDDKINTSIKFIQSRVSDEFFPMNDFYQSCWRMRRAYCNPSAHGGSFAYASSLSSFKSNYHSALIGLITVSQALVGMIGVEASYSGSTQAFADYYRRARQSTNRPSGFQADQHLTPMGELNELYGDLAKELLTDDIGLA